MALRSQETKKKSSMGALKAALSSVARRPSKLQSLCARKTLSAAEADDARVLMETAQPMPAKGRPRRALILHDFEAEHDWQISVARSEEVAVLDKLDDGWWLVDKSCGKGRGPFGLVPGNHCCWKLHEDDGVAVAAAAGAPASPSPAAPPPEAAAPRPAPALPPRPTAAADEPPGSGVRMPTAAAAAGAAPPPPPAQPSSEGGADYSDDDLASAFAYLDLLIHGDPFSTGPAPSRFNELCATSPEFAERVKAHADESRRRSADVDDPLALG